MRKILLLVCLALTSSSALAHDPRYFHELEMDSKARQARAVRKGLHTFEGVAALPVAVDAYHFDIELLPQEGALTGLVSIDLTATETMKQLALDSVGLKVSKVWFTNSVGVKSEAEFDVSISTLTVRFPSPVAQNSKFSLMVAYTATKNAGLMFVNNPGVSPTIYTSVEPQLASSWFPCIDNPEYKAKQVFMRVTAPDPYYVVSNGSLKTLLPHAESKTTTYEWEENFPIPTYLISIAAGHFKTIEDHWRNTPVQYFVPAELESKARYDWQRTPLMIEEFSKLWTPYPFEKYSMTAVPFYSGAMEHTTATTMSDALITGDREGEETVAHELAHHWWGDTVTLSSWDDLWLNEGTATYSEVLYHEKLNDHDSALQALIGDREGYLRYDDKGTKAIVDPSVLPDDKFSQTVYEKGAWVHHMLRQRLGDEHYFAALRSFLQKFAYSNASTADLKKSFEEASGEDLSDFFQQWVFGRGYPDLAMKWSYNSTNKTVQVQIDQRQERPFRTTLDLAIAVETPEGGQTLMPMTVTLSEKSHSFEKTLPADTVSVFGLAVDPEAKVLKKVTLPRSNEELHFWLGYSKNWLARYDALDSVDANQMQIEFVRDLIDHVHSEHAAPVRERMIHLLANTQGVKNFGAREFADVQAILKKAISDSEADVRYEAAVAASSFISPELTQSLLEQFEREDSPRIKGRLVIALATAKYPGAFELLQGELSKVENYSSQRKYIASLIEALGKTKDHRAVAVLIALAKGAHPELQAVAFESLGYLADPDTFNLLVETLRDPNASINLRISSAKALGHFGGVSAVRELNEQLKVEKNDFVKSAITYALELLGGRRGFRPDFRNLSLKGLPASLQW